MFRKKTKTKNMNTLSLKKATVADCSLIRSLASQIWEPTYGHILSKEQLDYMFDMMYALENIRMQMAEKGHIYFLFYSGNTACGYISLEQPEKDLFIFQKIYLLPRMQGKGIGRYMVEKGFEYIKEVHPAPCKAVLYVNRENKALEFYKRMGFHIAATRDYPIGNGYYMNDYVMEKNL